MALHKDPREVIEQYLRAAQLCLDEALEYPATLLLLCVTDAFGCYLSGKSVKIDGKEQKIPKKAPFLVLNDPLFGLQLSRDQIKVIKGSYRNKLAHNATIKRGLFLFRNQDGAPFVFEGKGALIRIGSFYKLVSDVWARFPQEKITHLKHEWNLKQLERLSKSNELSPDERRTFEKEYRRLKTRRAKRNKGKSRA